jgi:hypothetical protein
MEQQVVMGWPRPHRWLWSLAAEVQCGSLSPVLQVDVNTLGAVSTKVGLGDFLKVRLLNMQLCCVMACMPLQAACTLIANCRGLSNCSAQWATWREVVSGPRMYSSDLKTPVNDVLAHACDGSQPSNMPQELHPQTCPQEELLLHQHCCL